MIAFVLCLHMWNVEKSQYDKYIHMINMTVFTWVKWLHRGFSPPFPCILCTLIVLNYSTQYICTYKCEYVSCVSCVCVLFSAAFFYFIHRRWPANHIFDASITYQLEHNSGKTLYAEKRDVRFTAVLLFSIVTNKRLKRSILVSLTIRRWVV